VASERILCLNMKGLVCLSRHKRSEKAVEKRLLRRQLRSIALSQGFHDCRRCETVSLVSRVDLLSLAGSGVQVSDVPDIVKGEVLVDSRGQGSFQR
jgi:hypothetical protein